MRKISLTLKAATQEDLNVAICLRFAGFATLEGPNVADCHDSADFATLRALNVANCQDSADFATLRALNVAGDAIKEHARLQISYRSVYWPMKMIAPVLRSLITNRNGLSTLKSTSMYFSGTDRDEKPTVFVPATAVVPFSSTDMNVLWIKSKKATA